MILILGRSKSDVLSEEALSYFKVVLLFWYHYFILCSLSEKDDPKQKMVFLKQHFLHGGLIVSIVFFTNNCSGLLTEAGLIEL